MQRRLAGRQLDVDGFVLVDLDRDLLAAGEQVVLVERVGMLNLLPVPILDGGQILITVAEGVTGKSFSDRTRDNFMKVGLVALGTLFLIVMFNDLKGLAGAIFG